MRYIYSFITLLVILFILKSCATPMGPTGGEPDRSAPIVINTDPQQGSTNFSDREVSFTFDKYIDRNSFRQNVSIEPDLGIEFETSFRRKTATVRFASELPENTTVIVKVGTDVTDTNRNRLDSSYDLALSTGDVLDRGKITATAIDAETGRGESGQRIFLYREPFDLESRAVYISETDTSGRVEFGYIGEGIYKAFWVQDQNRDRIWDKEREPAQPFFENTFELSEGDSIDIGTLYISMPDTIAPRIEGVGLLSERRLRLRLSEHVEWDQDAVITVTDTLGFEVTNAFPLYMQESDENVLYAQSEESLPESNMYSLKPFGITDASENSLRVVFSPFIGSNEPDTTILRTISHNSANGLFPDEALEIVYSRFIDDQNVIDSLQVVDGERVINDWNGIETDRNILRVFPQVTWESGVSYQFRVWNPWEEQRELIEPDIWQRNQLGSIEFIIENSDPDIASTLRLTDSDNSIRVDTTFHQSVIIDNLPPLTYRAILFQDENGNERWDPGVVEPFEKPEPYTVRRSIPVREGFTSEVEVSYPVSGVRGLIPVEESQSESESESESGESDESDES
ncbi:MAG: Ig-like domain-containing protein [Balneolaceae bacterium]